MLINKKINPLLEALQYFNRRVNGTSVSDTMLRLESAYPERFQEIHSMMVPILELDNLLSAELVPDIDRLNFFFKQFEGINGADSIGTSTASIIFFEEAYKNFDTADELFERMSRFSPAEIRSKLRTAFGNYTTVQPKAELSLEEFWDFTESCPFPDETKWRIFDTYRHYYEYVSELSHILGPAMEIIIDHYDRFNDILDGFVEPNDGSLDIYEYVRSIISVDITAYENVLIYPTIMGFNSILLLIPDYDDGSEPLIIYLGILMKNLRQESVSIDIESLIRQIKSLGDQSRLEMLCSVKDKPTYGQDLSNKFSVSSTTVYHHMNKLIVAGLVDSTLDGNKVYFTMNRTNVVTFISRLCAVLLDCDIKDIPPNL